MNLSYFMELFFCVIVCYLNVILALALLWSITIKLSFSHNVIITILDNQKLFL